VYGRLISLIAAQGASLILAFTLQYLLARALGISNFGQYAFFLAMFNVFGLFGKFGFDQIMLRDSRNLLQGGDTKAFHLLRRAATLHVLQVSVLCASAFAIIAWNVFDQVVPGSTRIALTAAAVALPFATVTGLRQQTVMSLGQPVRSIFPEAIGRPLLMAIAVLVMMFVFDEVLLDSVVTAFCTAVILVWLLAELIECNSVNRFAASDKAQRSTAEHSESTVRTDLVRTAFPLLIVAGAFLLASQLDVIVLGFVSTAEQTGAYAVSARVTSLVQVGLIAIQSLVASQIRVAYLRRNTAEMQNQLHRVANFAAVTGLTVCVVLYIFVDDILLLFGSDFAFAADCTRILLVYHGVNCLTGATGVTLNMTDLQGLCARSLLIAVGANAALSIPLSVSFGAEGAALATVLTMAGWNLIMSAVVYRKRGVRTWFGIESIARFR
jgi:O-antigen/teichoic acid export membrane protein